MKIIFKTVRFTKSILPKKYKVKAIGVSLLLLVNSGLELIGLGAILPLFLVLLEDDISNKYLWANWLYTAFKLSNERQLVVLLAGGFFIAIIVKNILSLWITKIQSSFSYSLFKYFSLELHKLYYKRGFTFFKNTNSSILYKDFRLAPERFASTIVLGSLTFMNEVLILICIIIGIAVYNIQVFGLLLLTVIPSFFIFYSWVRKRSILLGQIRNKIEPIINQNTFQSIFGYVDIVISGSEKSFRKKIEENLEELVDINIKTNIYNLAPSRVIESSLMFAIAIIISFGIYFLESKTDLVKLLGLFVVAGYRIIPSINRMMIAINGLNQNIWVFDILSPLNQEINKEKNESKEFYFKKYLELNAIDFSYPDSDEKVISNFSIRINKGEVIGLVGPSGAGKTTMMNILLGFLKPTNGIYKIDDTILSEEYHDSFYKKIGYVQQQVYLLDDTIAGNVAFGCEFIDQEKLNRVLEQASLLDMVATLPEGINTKIGENGAKLSGGQRQRVGIARALYFDAEILFFDEATSALDTETEKEITESIHNLQDGNLTMIIIAHRTSTLKSCNRIIEVNQNEISLK